MKTNYQMLIDLYEVYQPEQEGVVTMKEIYLINEKLHLDEMDGLQLRNLRDFVVLFWEMERANSDSREEKLQARDKMSAVTSVIDNKLWNIGAEV